MRLREFDEALLFPEAPTPQGMCGVFGTIHWNDPQNWIYGLKGQRGLAQHFFREYCVAGQPLESNNGQAEFYGLGNSLCAVPWDKKA